MVKIQNNQFKLGLLLIIFWSSCGIKAENGNNNENRKMDSINERLIIGDWRLCKIITGSITIHANVCPKVVFIENGFGIDRIKLDTFRWDIIDNKLFIKYNSKNKLSRFQDSVYDFFIEKKDSSNLRLTIIGPDSFSHFKLFKVINIR